MYNTKFILTLLCFLFLFSCQKETKLVFKESSFTTEKNTLVEIIIPVAEGNNNIGSVINSDLKKEIVKSLQIVDNETTDLKSIEESIAAFNNEYSNFKKDFPEDFQPWEAQIDGEIMYQSQEIISMSLTSYINTGGAQGNLNISFLNYDAKTGNRIKNIDLFSDIENFKNVAKSYFENAIEDKSNAFNANSFELPENIGYTEEGLILLFNAYETAPYASEIIEFVIPFEKISSLLIFDSTQ